MALTHDGEDDSVILVRAKGSCWSVVAVVDIDPTMTSIFKNPFTKPRSRARRAIVHCGLHKTASTYLQAVCRDNSMHLRQDGIFFECITPYPAHHELAWSVLRGEEKALTSLIKKMPSDCSDLLISSEDLENLLVSKDATTQFEAVLNKCGIERIEYYFVVRSAGDRFSSLMSEMSKHKVYLDWFGAFDEVMRTGALTVKKSRSDPNGIPEGWSFVFDLERYFGSFSSTSKGNINVVPFKSAGPFPGSMLLSQAFEASPLNWLKGLDGEKFNKWRNPRQTIAFQEEGYQRAILSKLSLATSNTNAFQEALSNRIPPEEVRNDICREIEQLFPVPEQRGTR